MDIYSAVKSFKSLKEFINGGGDVNYRDKNGYTILWLLFVHNRVTKYYDLVLKNGGDVHTLTPENKAMVTSIHKLNTLQLFVKHGANLDCVDDTRCTYAHYILDLETLEYAQSVGVDLNARNDRGETALHTYYRRFGSCYGVDTSVVDCFITAGLDINSEDCLGRRVVHIAHPRDNADLVLRGADFTATDNRGWTCIHHKVHDDYLAYTIIAFYVSQGVDINARDFEGKTALLLSTSPLISWSLIKYGADISCIDVYGRTALHNSIEGLLKFKEYKWMTNTRIEIIKSMIESGADMKLMDNMGKTCMDDFLVKVKKCSPYSKSGLKYSEILKVALKNGLDNMKYGNILFDMTKRKGRDGHELDSVIFKGAMRWKSACFRYTMVMIRSKMESGPLVKKSRKNMVEVENLVKGVCNLGDDIFRRVVEFL